MKKIITTLTLILTAFVPSYAIEDTPLPFNDEPVQLETTFFDNEIGDEQKTVIEEETIEKELTFSQKIQKALKGEVAKTDTPYFMLNDVLTHNFEKGPLESIHMWGAYQGHLGINMQDGENGYSQYSQPAINLGFDGKFKNGKEDFRLMFGFQPRHEMTFWNALPADMYIATNRIPYHRIIFGNTRPNVTQEGGNSQYTLPFILRSQTARTYGTARKFGVRVLGNYDLIEYDLGGYSSDTYFRKFFPGAEFTGWVNFKPLGKTDGKYGKLKLGGGINSGQHEDRDFFVGGAYIGYEYKKFFTNFEWAQADGSNGLSGYSNKKSGGLNATAGYNVTNKVQVVARYDQFDPDRNIKHNMRREYSAGINYFLKGQGLKLIFNYIFCQNQGKDDSHRLLIGTQILL